MKTVEIMRKKVINIFGLEHWNTVMFLEDCENNMPLQILNWKFDLMMLLNKINQTEIAHAIVEINHQTVVVVELKNKTFDFYATAFRAIQNEIEKVFSDCQSMEILDIITD